MFEISPFCSRRRRCRRRGESSRVLVHLRERCDRGRDGRVHPAPAGSAAAGALDADPATIRGHGSSAATGGRQARRPSVKPLFSRRSMFYPSLEPAETGARASPTGEARPCIRSWPGDFRESGCSTREKIGGHDVPCWRSPVRVHVLPACVRAPESRVGALRGVV